MLHFFGHFSLWCFDHCCNFCCCSLLRVLLLIKVTLLSSSVFRQNAQLYRAPKPAPLSQNGAMVAGRFPPAPVHAATSNRTVQTGDGKNNLAHGRSGSWSCQSQGYVCVMRREQKVISERRFGPDELKNKGAQRLTE